MTSSPRVANAAQSLVPAVLTGYPVDYTDGDIENDLQALVNAEVAEVLAKVRTALNSQDDSEDAWNDTSDLVDELLAERS